MEMGKTQESILYHLSAIQALLNAEGASVTPFDGPASDEKQTINPLISFAMDNLLGMAGINESFSAILADRSKLQEENANLNERLNHTNEIITMLTRFRFSPHTESKSRVRKMSELLEDVTTLIDKEGLVPPELQDLDPEIIEKLRSGDMVLVDLGDGKVAYQSASDENVQQGGDSESSGQNPVESSEGSERKEERAKGKHQRRTKGSLDRKFAHVEKVKCYTSFNDTEGCKNDPPKDSSGNPMVYVGERLVRRILVRVPARYVLYEFYAQTFRSDLGEEKAVMPQDGEEQTSDPDQIIEITESTETVDENDTLHSDFESGSETCYEYNEASQGYVVATEEDPEKTIPDNGDATSQAEAGANSAEAEETLEADIEETDMDNILELSVPELDTETSESDRPGVDTSEVLKSFSASRDETEGNCQQQGAGISQSPVMTQPVLTVQEFSAADPPPSMSENTIATERCPEIGALHQEGG